MVLSPQLQRRLGIFDHERWFLDSYAILASSDAVQQGLDPARPNPLDVYHRSHSYSQWWFALGRLGVTRADNFLFGGTMVLLFCVVALLNLAPRSRCELVWQAALLLSPPVLLAINRANNDLAIFALVGTGIWLSRRPEGARPAWFGAAVVLATGLKFFPFVAAGAPVLLRPVKRGVWWAAVTSLAALLVLASVREDLARATFPAPDGTHVFGASVFWRNLGWVGRGPVNLSLALLAIAAFWLAWRKRTTGLAESMPAPEADVRMPFMAGALIMLACFTAGISYAYRWVFALWLAPWLWQQAWGREPRAGSRGAARLGCVLLTVAMWMDGAFCFVVNSVMGSMDVSRLARWEAHWNICMQPVVWVLMLLLAGWVIEALLATAQDWRRRA